MTPSRPYLLRGLYEWIVDNGLTPHLLVNADGQGVSAPVEFAEAGRLVLNVSPTAVRDLSLSNEAVAFNARFGGTPQAVYVPVAEVLAIYARENGQGMLFTDEHGGDDPPPSDGDNSDLTPARPGPGLRVVK